MREVIATMALGGCAAAIPLTGQGTRATAETIAAAVDSIAVRAVAAGLGPALGVAVVMDGRTIYLRSHGMADASRGVPADDRTLWYVASTSKSFTGFAVSLLAERGELSFDESVSALVPAARWHPDVRPAQLTLARFLSHTHHLNGGALVTSAAFTGAIPEAGWPELLAAAGPTGSTDLVYTNLGYNVAAMAIDARRPEGWRTFLDREVLAPAGIKEIHSRVSGLDPRRIAMPHELRPDGRYLTAPFVKTDATMNAAGGHLGTLADLARWTIVQMDSGRIDGRQVYPQGAVARSQRMLAPQTRERARRFAYFDREGWGAGWDIGRYRGERMVSRFGGYATTRSHLSFLPGRRIGVVAQATGGLAGTVTDIVAALVYDLESGRPDARAVADERLNELIGRLDEARQRVANEEATRAARQRPLDRPWSDFAGQYLDEAYGSIRFRVAGDGLVFEWGVLTGPVEVFDAARHRLRFELAGSGQVADVEFAGAGPARAVSIGGTRFTRQDR